MKQSTTILNEAKPSSILLYSAPWNLILIKFKCSNCFITYKALFYSNFEILWKLKFLKVWNFIKILNFNFFFNQKKFLKFWIFFFKFWTLNLFITSGSILLFFYWPEAIHVTFHFLTYWLAKSNFRAIKNHIALSCKINEWNYFFMTLHLSLTASFIHVLITKIINQLK
jgi:hypothetical protein